MTRLNRTLVTAALLCPLASCVQVDHFTAEPSRYDNLFFGSDAPSDPLLQESKWRIYALFGLVSWGDAGVQFAGRELGVVAADLRPMNIVVETEMTFLNGLAAVGVNVLAYGFGVLVFIPRSTEVIGWRSAGG